MTQISAFVIKTKARVGVLDIGSNSVRFVIYSIDGAAFSPVYDEKVLAGLGRDLRRTGKLNPDGMAQTLVALKRFSGLAIAQNLDNLFVAATAALRDASDAAEFITTIKHETGLEITPLSGEDEGILSALGVIAGETRADGLAVDLGGASLEMVPVSGGKTHGSVSYQLGPFAMYGDLFNPSDLRPKIEAILGSDFGEKYQNIDTLYLIGGAWRNLATIDQKRSDYPLKVAHNYQLGFEPARSLADWAYSAHGIDELLNWPNLNKIRAKSLPYSGLLLSVLLEKIKPKNVAIAPGGLRDGLVFRSLDKKTKPRNALFDACTSIAALDSRGYGMGLAIFDFLAGIHSELPRSFGLENENRIRKAACFLIGTGVGLHPSHRAQIIYEIALYGPLPGLTHKERAYLALMLFRSFRAFKAPPEASIIRHLLTDEDRRCANIYGEAIRASVVLSGRSPDALNIFSIATKQTNLILSAPNGAKDLIIDRQQHYFEKLACDIDKIFLVKA